MWLNIELILEGISCIPGCWKQWIRKKIFFEKLGVKVEYSNLISTLSSIYSYTCLTDSDYSLDHQTIPVRIMWFWKCHNFFFQENVDVIYGNLILQTGFVTQILLQNSRCEVFKDRNESWIYQGTKNCKRVSFYASCKWFKVQIIWEEQKNRRKSSLYFWHFLVTSKISGIFFNFMAFSK